MATRTNAGLTTSLVALWLGVSLVTCDGSPTVPQSGPPASILVIAGADQTGTVGAALPRSIQVKVLDAKDRPVPNQPVQFVVTSGGGSLSPAASNTSADGLASTQWTLGTSVSTPQVIEVRVPDPTHNQTVQPAIIAATATPDAANDIAKFNGDGQTAPAGTAVATAPSVKVVDQYSNPVTSTLVSWKVTGGGGTLSSGTSATSATNGDGVAVMPGTWTLGQTTDINTLSAAIGNHSVSFAANAVAGQPARLAFLVPPSGIATNGERLPQQPVVQLQDQYGNATKVADVVVQITQIPGSGPATLTIWNDTTRTNSDGVATFTGTTINGRAGDGYQLGFTAPSTSTLASGSISLQRGQAYSLALRVPADGASRGSPFAIQPVLQVVDTGDNPVPTAVCVNARIVSGPSLTGSTQVAGSSDTYSFTDIGFDSAASPGIYTIIYTTGCCTPDQTLHPAQQMIQLQ